ncbi:MAG: amidase family protein, partial [Limnohabitans sp.]
MTHLTDLDASALSHLIHDRQVSCAEVMQAFLERISRQNPVFNAIVNLASTDSLMSEARAADLALARGHSHGWLHGIPQAIKDTAHAVG